MSVSKPPNVLLIVLDTVRESSTSINDHSQDTTPYLRSFAAAATNYTQCRAPGIWSPPSHASIFTGVEPDVHGVRAENDALAPGETIWEWLRDENSYSTGVFSDNAYLQTNATGLVHGFDHITHYPFRPFQSADSVNTVDFSEGSSAKNYFRHSLNSDKPIRTFLNGAYYKYRKKRGNVLTSPPGGDYVRQFLRWENKQSGPWAACVNLMDAHLPYNVLPKFQTTGYGESDLFEGREIINLPIDVNCGDVSVDDLQALLTDYHCAIIQADAAVRMAIEGLKQRNEYENTLIVVTADHGEAFGEPSELDPSLSIVNHRMDIPECLLHVPLVVKHPNQESRETIDDLATNMRFPDVVRSVVSENSTQETFRKDSLVVSSENPRTQAALDYAREMCGDSTYIERTSRAVYRQDGGSIEKFMSMDMGDERDGFTAYRRFQRNKKEIGDSMPQEGEILDIISFSFDEINSDQNKFQDSISEYDDMTKSRLKDLGYLN